MQTKVKWLERVLFQGPHLALVTNQKQMDSIMKRVNLPSTPYCSAKGHATTHSFLNGDGNLMCVVGLDLEKAAGEDPIDVAALLVHEAVHVWQQVRSGIVFVLDAERTGGLEAEMEAYAIQNISATLMSAYKELLCHGRNQS